MLRKILVSSLILASSLAHSQGTTSAKPNSTIAPTSTNTKPTENNLTSQQIKTLDTYLLAGEHQELFSYLQRTNASKQSQIKYLVSKQNYGIIPTYWIIADMYAKERNYPETHKWFYISLIMTQQDSHLCSDETARNAPRKLMEYFPESVHVTRNSPQYIESSMREVAFFISNLHTRIDPSWVCHYGDKPVSAPQSITINRKNWKEKRNEIYNRFMSKYQK